MQTILNHNKMKTSKHFLKNKFQNDLTINLEIFQHVR